MSTLLCFPIIFLPNQPTNQPTNQPIDHPNTQAVVDAGAIAFLAPLVQNADAKLKRQVCSALAQIAKHSLDLAEVVVDGEIFPPVLTCLKDTDELVRKNSATLVREIAKHTPELAQLIVNEGGAAALVDYVNDSVGALSDAVLQQLDGQA